MSIITFTQRGSFNKFERYLNRQKSKNINDLLKKYGAQGVIALANATPIDTSLTANSWYYEIVQRPGYYSIRWFNRNRQNGSNVAILLEYGHGTRNGGYVQGLHYVAPAMKPIFDAFALEIEKEVTR